MNAKPKKRKMRALADYIRKFDGTFPCGERVKPDGSNTQFSVGRGRSAGREYWRIRCLACNRDSAADAMARKRLAESAVT